MLSEVQQKQVQDILDDASNRISEVMGEPARVHFNTGANHHLLKLKNTICEYYKINWADILGHSRMHEVVIARQMFCWFGYTHYNYKKTYMAAHLNRHHTTVIHSIDTVNDILETRNGEYVRDAQTITKMLSSN
jgi:chromosomal replication initiation ATPase DnaA